MKVRNVFTNLYVAFAVALLLTALVDVFASDNFTEENYVQVDYAIQKGDTLWSIGRENCYEEDDLREWVWEVEQLNNIHNEAVGHLYVHQVITIYKSIK